MKDPWIFKGSQKVRTRLLTGYEQVMGIIRSSYKFIKTGKINQAWYFLFPFKVQKMVLYENYKVREATNA